MTHFLNLLALYYLCDSTAALRPMTSAEIASCMATYEAVKAHFVSTPPAPTTPARSRYNRQAYLAFKSWEVENSGLVARLKDEADTEARARLQG
jgi:hypothetical protein